MRFPGSGPGTGEVGARPTLTRNCERLCGTPPHSASQATCRCPPGHRCSRRTPFSRTAGHGPRGKGPRRTIPMSQVRRAVAWCTTLTAAFSFTLFLTSPAQAADPASQATADAAVAWLKTQQQSDGGFELAMFPGFETRDASLAIAEDAQTGTTWSTTRGARCARRPPLRRHARRRHAARRARRLRCDRHHCRRRGQDHRVERVAARPRPVGVRSRRRRHPGEPRRAPRLRLRRRHRLVRARVQRHALRRPREEARVRHAAARGAVGHPRRPAGERWLELQR